jgi:Leucine-rich repeat (LRR) protein
LKTLDLSANYLKGTIPTEIGALRNLQILRIGGNGLEGGIPSEIGLLTMLGKSIDCIFPFFSRS